MKLRRDASPYVGPYRLDDYELNKLATYNSERARGLVHTEDYRKKMAALQERWNRGMEPRASA